jgi:anti-sigma factor RsiW
MSYRVNPYQDELLDHRSALEEITAARMRLAEYSQRLDSMEVAVKRAMERRYEQKAKRNAPPPQERASSADSSR